MPEKVLPARDLDDKLIAAWTGHPHLRVIGNESDFETKMKRLIAEIASLLGEPEPLEIERNFAYIYYLQDSGIEHCHPSPARHSIQARAMV